jgi:hypothetical protein
MLIYEYFNIPNFQNISFKNTFPLRNAKYPQNHHRLIMDFLRGQTGHFQIVQTGHHQIALPPRWGENFVLILRFFLNESIVFGKLFS